MLDNLINTKELCERYGVTKGAVNHWRRVGMPYIQKSTKKIYYDLEAVEKWHLEKINEQKK